MAYAALLAVSLGGLFIALTTCADDALTCTGPACEAALLGEDPCLEDGSCETGAGGDPSGHCVSTEAMAIHTQ